MQIKLCDHLNVVFQCVKANYHSLQTERRLEYRPDTVFTIRVRKDVMLELRTGLQEIARIKHKCISGLFLDFR